jgi:Cu(I)/Ag(I) efflux system membrane fusion protein
MNKNIIITAVVMLMIGVAAGYLLAPTSEIPEHKAAGQTEAKKPLFYRHPMNSAITSPVPAKDNMNMDYIPVYADDGGDTSVPAGTVTIDPTVVQNIGVRTTAAKLTTLSRTIRTVGRVAFDEERVARLHPKYDGWIEKLFIDRTGDSVTKDTMLMAIYSPQLVATQEEYLLALNNAETLKESPFRDIREGAASLKRSARERLELFDVPAHQIAELERTRKVMKSVHIHSPFDGIVMNIGAREGSRITPETELYMIADLSKLWVIVDLYEDDMPWVKEGDMAQMRVSGIPGETFEGKVAYIYPYLEAKTRTVKARLEVDNVDLKLKPEMFANVTLMSNRQLDALTVPSEAVVRTGAREQLFIERAPGKFEPREIKIGVSADGRTQIIEGVHEGEKVVTSSQFLIDSDSKLNEATAKMLEVSKPPSAAQNMSMDQMDMQMDPMQMDSMDMSDMRMDNMDMGDHSAGQSNGTDAGRTKGEGQDVPNQMQMGGNQ